MQTAHPSSGTSSALVRHNDCGSRLKVHRILSECALPAHHHHCRHCSTVARDRVRRDLNDARHWRSRMMGGQVACPPGNSFLLLAPTLSSIVASLASILTIPRSIAPSPQTVTSGCIAVRSAQKGGYAAVMKTKYSCPPSRQEASA